MKEAKHLWVCFFLVINWKKYRLHESENPTLVSNLSISLLFLLFLQYLFLFIQAFDLIFYSILTTVRWKYWDFLSIGLSILPPMENSIDSYLNKKILPPISLNMTTNFEFLAWIFILKLATTYRNLPWKNKL